MSLGPSVDSASTSSSLIQRVKTGDSVAWERLVRIYAPLIYDWARRAGLQDSDAADVMQETFHTVAKSIDSFRRNRPADSFRGWLRTITRSKTTDLFRQRGKLPPAAGGSEARRQIDDLAVPPAIDDGQESLELSSIAHGVLQYLRDQFSDNAWQSFWRTAVEGDSAADVAEDLGISTSAVHKSRARVLRRLRDELGDLFT